MPYMNKRNRFVAAAKNFAETNGLDPSAFKKDDLLAIAQSINMKGIPTWVLKDYKSAVSKGLFDLASLVNPVTV